MKKEKKEKAEFFLQRIVFMVEKYFKSMCLSSEINLLQVYKPYSLPLSNTGFVLEKVSYLPLKKINTITEKKRPSYFHMVFEVIGVTINIDTLHTTIQNRNYDNQNSTLINFNLETC